MTPNTIKFYSDGTEVFRLSKNGIWANPDIPTDEAAKLVLKAMDHYIKTMLNKAIADEREECAKAADDQWVKNPAISGGDAIRARGQA